MPTPRPMLASNEVVQPDEFEDLLYPRIASPKLDGFRILNVEGQPITRSGKFLRNRSTRKALTHPDFAGLDGELTVGSPTAPNALHLAQSAFGSIEGSPDFTWHIFDDLRRYNTGFWKYWQTHIAPRSLPSFCTIVPQVEVHSPSDLIDFNQRVVEQGYEGVIIRDPLSPYKGADGKGNRSTRRQGWMLKIKPLIYREVRITRVNQRYTNQNEQGRSPLGFAERSSHQANRVPLPLAGSFDVLDPLTSNAFAVSLGPITDKEAEGIWANREAYRGRIATVKYYPPAPGMLPRSAQFVAWRVQEDLG